MHRLILALAALVALALPAPAQARPADDPRWVFFTSDKTEYRSPWYRGAHRVMIPYGCTRAPYYSPDPRCSGGRGFHHGIDIAIDCGKALRAGRLGWVVSDGGLSTTRDPRPYLNLVATDG